MATDGGPDLPFDKQRLLLPIATAIFLILCFRSAWVGDDAYITLRTVDNFVNGYGLTWNISERVQAYTHPLWMFVLSAVYFVTREVYYSTVGLSLILSTCTAVFVGLLARDLRVGAIAILVLGMSKAFVDYSTSGLENPLTHLVIVAYVSVFVGDKNRDNRFVLLNLLACLAVLNRMDALLLFIPSLVYAGRGLSLVRILRSIAIGFSPFLLWELFSVIYYGFPFPNTAYAKLGSGIPSIDLIANGFHYLIDSLTLDPITLVLIALGSAIPLIHRNASSASLIAGSVFYLIYVVRIGGDFMSGRFLAAPLLLSVLVLILAELPIRAYVCAQFVAVGIGLIMPLSPLRADAGYGANADFQGRTFMDERARYYPKFGLLNVLEQDRPEQRKQLTFAFEGEPIVQAAIGFAGYCQGPDTHIVDYLGLADPLLSRLPHHGLDWMVGHYPRVFSFGYLETISKGENVIEPANLAQYYAGLQTITRGPLFALERFGEIIRYNLGLKDSLVEDEFETQRRNNEAHELFLMGEHRKTLEILEGSGHLENNPEAMYLMSKALRLEGELTEASGWILKAFEHNQRKLAYQYELFAVADALAAAGRQEEVIPFYDDLIAIRPEYGGVYLKKGFLLIENGNVDQGVLSLWRALTYFSVADKHISTWINKNSLDISVLGPLGDLLPFDHRNPETYMALYDFLASRREIDHSEHALVTGMAVTGWNKRIGMAIIDHIGDALVKGEFTATGQFLTRLIEIREDVGILQFYAGFVHENLGQNDRAAARYRIVTKLIPEDPIAYTGLARVLRSLGQFEEAEKVENTARALRPKS